MEKRVIIEGDEKVVNVIMKENKVRVSRGLVKFTPVAPGEKGKGKIEEEEEEKGNRGRSSRGKSTEITDK
ncbi:hypothetical protein DXA50_00520 [Butyricimonas virosa]|jgi:hypothetical protein|uniref:Uncharacterized protein n=1 Tax=Butyricimonas virosa TaxID=544645 RepID=A0A413ITY6_9BACT|nr:hypothetical protein [Butyricimonas virosa]RGY21373.1 hypothetical protein DXA50_00520 [Butyricimonas virosa]DAH05584.1 MAG TPA: hypothetical protein [Caudoviricetes sp.]